MSEIKVGELIVGNAERDAIHMAVAPVIAGEDLKPGEHVGFEGDGTVVSYRQSNQHIGVVDPFLKDEVEKGQKFWLFLYPKTVANLRHYWDHPQFRTSPTEASQSVAWLQQYATQHQLTYNDMLTAVGKFVDGGGNRDDRLEDHFKDYETPAEFWEHFYVVTGKRGSGDFWGCCI